MIVVEASALIAHLDAGDAHHDSVERILLDYAGRPLGSTTVTFAEVLVGPAAAGRLEEAQAALEVLGIEELELDTDAPPGSRAAGGDRSQAPRLLRPSRGARHVGA